MRAVFSTYVSFGTPCLRSLCSPVKFGGLTPQSNNSLPKTLHELDTGAFTMMVHDCIPFQKAQCCTLIRHNGVWTVGLPLDNEAAI